MWTLTEQRNSARRNYFCCGTFWRSLILHSQSGEGEWGRGVIGRVGVRLDERLSFAERAEAGGIHAVSHVD